LKLFTFLAVFLLSLSSLGHEYFFGFSELEYNEITQKLEATIIVSTHELERALAISAVNSGDLAKLKVDSPQQKAVKNYLMNHFVVEANETIKFNLIGSEVFLNGTTNFYFESESIELKRELNITFDLLMDVFKQQQNKITLTCRNKKYTRTFLYTERKQLIIIEKN